MPLRLAILGLDLIQHHWLSAVKALCASGQIELVAIGHPSQSAARDVTEFFKSAHQPAPPTFEDTRTLLKESSPQVILLDRPQNASLDFLLTCAAGSIAILSLGPPVESLAEAQTLSAALEPRTPLLYIWPRFADSPAAVHCAQADDFLRPIRFASGAWLGIHHALAKSINDPATLPVRSLSVLAWDALATLIHLMGLPTSVYAVIRGTISSGSSFADISGAASVALRFADDAAASLTLCDRSPDAGHPLLRQDLTLWASAGTLKLSAESYEFLGPEGKIIDTSPPSSRDSRHNAHAQSTTPLFSDTDPATAHTLQTLQHFLHHYSLPSSPHRGWEHQLAGIAATMEALIVSHRTGQPESPERFLHLRR